MYPVWALIGLVVFMWGAAFWAGYRDDEPVGPEDPIGMRHDGRYKDAA